MKKFIFCKCGSGKPRDFCCAPKIKMTSIPIIQKNDSTQILQKLHIGSQFDLRHRGLFEFYGDDLIAYKLEKPKSASRNGFLTIFGKYFTEYLEDACPSSWEKIDENFWEELLFMYFPFHIKITPEKREVEKFLFELKRFTRWLDKRIGSQWTIIITKLIEQSSAELKYCEHLINILYLQYYPRFHQDDWDYKQEIENHARSIQQFDKDFYYMFEVVDVNGPITTLKDIDTFETYPVIGLPDREITTGILLSGGIAKKQGDMFWTWAYPEGVYPKRALKYLEHVLL